MCVQYNTVFTNDKINCGAQITIGPHTLDCLSPMIVNGIVIDAEGFECLSIDKPETHPEDALSIFDYDINKYGSYILKNYHVRTEIPVEIIEKPTGKESMESIIIEMDNKDSETRQTLKMFDTEITVNDFYLEGAFNTLYREVNEKYSVKICAFCTNSFGAAFGEVEFCNQLCFEKISGEYREIAKKTKYAILELMAKHPGTCRNVYLTCSCNKFMEAQGGT